MNYEEQYMNILAEICNQEPTKNKRTGANVYRIPTRVMQIDLGKEFPILKSKKVFWKSAIEEILWIMRDQSNNIKDLRPHIWDDWADENGYIGRAYGYQVKRNVVVNQNGQTLIYPNQVAYVLDTLKKDPTDRRCVIDLWNVSELAHMNLTPCCYSSVFNIIDGKLNCTLNQRSGDFPVGVPFNTTQYAALTILFARHIGVEPGILTHVISDCHVYEDQIDGVSEMSKNYLAVRDEYFKNMIFFNEEKYPDEFIEEIKNSNPKLVIDSDKTSFWDADINTIRVEDYKSFPEIKFNVTK